MFVNNLVSRLSSFRKAIGRSTSRFQSTLPAYADVVVVGGGSVGCSTLYHLSKLGTDAILLERNKLSSGTTWHSAGGIWRMWAYDVDNELADTTYRLMSDILPNEYGFSVGFEPAEGLFLSANKRRHDEYRRITTMGKLYGMDSQELKISDLPDLYPQINTDNLYGAILTAGSGHVEPTSWCVGLSRAAASHGLQTFEDCPVSDVFVEEDDLFGYRKVTGVKVGEDVVKTNAVLLTTGAWGPKMAEKLGVHIPTMAIKHAYTLTEPTKAFLGQPMIRDHDISAYLSIRVSGSMTVGGYEPNPQFWEAVGDDFVFGLFDLDWDRYGVHFENGCTRLPILRSMGIKTEICGPMSFTPDHRPCMGEVPGIRGLYVGCGMDLGIMMGGGYGQQLAEWVTHGRPSKHMFRFDIGRYSTRVTPNKGWLKERVHECHKTMYKAKTPHDEPLSGRNLFMSPFHEQLLNAGCVFEERMGCERPAWFSTDGTLSPVLDYDWYGAYDGTTQHKDYAYRDRVEQEATFGWPTHQPIINAEAEVCRRSVGLLDTSSSGKILLSGRDATIAAPKLFTQVPASSRASLGTLLLNDAGLIEADAFVTSLSDDMSKFLGKEGEAYYIQVGGPMLEHVLRHMKTHLLDTDLQVDVTDISHDLCSLTLIGTETATIVSDIVQTNSAILKPVMASIGGSPSVLISSRLGETPVTEIIMKPEAGPNILSRILDESTVKPVHVGYRAFDSLLIESGVHYFDGALRSTDTPLDVGLLDLCDLSEGGDFIGRRNLDEAVKLGSRRRLVRVEVSEAVPLWGSEVIYRDGLPIGFVRVATFATGVKKSIGYGVVVRNDANIDETWIRSGRYKVERMGVMYDTHIEISCGI